MFYHNNFTPEVSHMNMYWHIVMTMYALWHILLQCWILCPIVGALLSDICRFCRTNFDQTWKSGIKKVFSKCAYLLWRFSMSRVIAELEYQRIKISQERKYITVISTLGTPNLSSYGITMFQVSNWWTWQCIT